MDIPVDRSDIQVSMSPDVSPPQQAGGVSGGSPSESAAGSPPAAQEVVQAAQVQEHITSRSISLSFSTYGKKNDKISVAVIDEETGKVIREIPPEELQRLSGKLEEMVGMVFDGRV